MLSNLQEMLMEATLDTAADIKALEKATCDMAEILPVSDATEVSTSMHGIFSEKTIPEKNDFENDETLKGIDLDKLAKLILDNKESLYIVRGNDELDESRGKEEWVLLDKIVQKIAEDGYKLLNTNKLNLMEVTSLKKYKNLVCAQQANQKQLLKKLKSSKLSKYNFDEILEEVIENNNNLKRHIDKSIEEKQGIEVIKEEINQHELVMNSYLKHDLEQIDSMLLEENNILSYMLNEENLKLRLIEILKKLVLQHNKQIEILNGCILGVQENFRESQRSLVRQRNRYEMIKTLSGILKGLSLSPFIKNFLSNVDAYFKELEPDKINSNVVWGRKNTPDQQPNYFVEKAKVKGTAIGAFFKTVDKPNSSGWIGKLGYNSLIPLESPELSSCSHVRRGSALESMLEKIAADLYDYLSDGKYLVPKTRLAELPIKNIFTENNALTQVLLDEINQGRHPEINEGVYVMSKFMEDYRDLHELKSCVVGEKESVLIQKQTSEERKPNKQIDDSILKEINTIAQTGTTSSLLKMAGQSIDCGIVDLNFKAFIEATNQLNKIDSDTTRKKIYLLMKKAYEYIKKHTPNLTEPSKIELNFKIITLEKLELLLDNTRSVIDIDPYSISISDQERYNYGLAAKEYVDRLTLELTITSWLNEEKLFKMRDTLLSDVTKVSLPVFSETCNHLTNGDIEQTAALDDGDSLWQLMEKKYFFGSSPKNLLLEIMKKHLLDKTHHLLLCYLIERKNTLNELIYQVNKNSDLPILFGIKNPTSHDIASLKRLRNDSYFRGCTDEEIKAKRKNILVEQFAKISQEEKNYMINRFKKVLNSASSELQNQWNPALRNLKEATYLDIMSRGFLKDDYLTDKDKEDQLEDIKKRLTEEIDSCLLKLETVIKQIVSRNPDRNIALLKIRDSLKGKLSNIILDILSDIRKSIKNECPLRFALLRLNIRIQKIQSDPKFTDLLTDLQQAKIAKRDHIPQSGEKLLNFEEYLKLGKLPEHIIIEGKKIPLHGVMEILAIGRLLSDTDVLGGSAKNVGFLIERDFNGAPKAARAVKIDPGYAFNFIGPQNILFQSFNSQSKDNPLKEDKRHLQYGNMAKPLLWTNLSEQQRNQFILALDHGLKSLKDNNEIFNKFINRNDFHETPKNRLPLPKMGKYWDFLQNNLIQQEEIYHDELDTLNKKYLRR